jgi:hypothetical protein
LTFRSSARVEDLLAFVNHPVDGVAGFAFCGLFDELENPLKPLDLIRSLAGAESPRELWTESGRDHRKSRKGDWQPRGAEINTAEPGTVARTCTLTPATGRSRVSVVKSQVEDYRAKAKEYARLTAVTKSLREGRRYRKLAEMCWALALGEEPENVQPSKMIVKTSPT